MRLLFILALFAASTGAQTVRVAGGSSTLFNSSGASVTAYTPQSTVTLAGGVSQGRFVFGASDSFMYRGLGVTAGTDYFSASVDGAGLSEQVFGLTVQSKNVTAFVGSVGTGSSTPFFQTSRVSHFGAGLMYHTDLHGVRLSSLGVVAGGQRTGLGSASWSTSTLKLSGTGGWLNNAPLMIGQAQWQPLHFLGLGAYHQDLWMNSLHATADNASVFATLGNHVTAQASLLRGVSATGRVTIGESAGAGFRLWHISEQTNWYKSNSASFLTHTIIENLSRWSFSQTITQSAGKPSISFGGSYHSNRITVSVDHSVLFFPLAGRGFQQVTGVSLSFRVPHTDAAVNLSTNVSPTGKTLYSVSGEDYAQMRFLPTASVQTAKPSGRFIITGTVTDADGQPVEGAAVSVGKQIVYTNSAGEFQVRVNKKKAVTLTVLPEEFATVGHWVVTDCPSEAQPGLGVKIQLTRVQG